MIIHIKKRIKMKTIAVFHPSAELYGADRIMVLATKAISDYIPVIYVPSEGDLIPFIQQELPNAIIKICDKLPIISRALFSVKGSLATAQKYYQFKRFIEKEHKAHNFEAFYVNTLACSILLPALEKLKVPIFTHVHEILESPKIAAKLTAKIVFKYSKTVISVSNAVQENLHLLTKKRNAKSIIVHNGIQRINCPKKDAHNALKFYLFGRIKPEKGQWYLLEALREIPKNKLRNTQFNFVGGTLKGHEYLKEDLMEKVVKYGLSPYVRFVDFTPNIQEHMAQADICLVPSLMKDPFPTTVLEAMSAGKVVIASDTGGAKEAIKDWETGFIIPADKPRKFAKVIQLLIDNNRVIQRVGSNASIAFDENFTTNHFNQRWLDAIDLAS